MKLKHVKAVFLSLGMMLFIVTACKKDAATPDPYKCTACIAAPQALAANDAISKGVYKGVVIGSTGTVAFNILNGGSTITATLVIDGTTAELTSSVTWTAGAPYVAPFTGTLNGTAVSITFSVSASGSNPEVTSSDIPGHTTASFTIVKETSTSLIECFEGIYHTTKPEDGTFNLILSRTAKLWGAIAHKDGSSETNDAGGVITGDKIIESNGTEMGTLSGDEINGSFTDNNGKTVTIKGKRTL